MSELRVDRLITLYGMRLLLRMAASSRKLKIPILMYHSISDEDERGVHPYYRINTSQETFGKQMGYLYDNGYSVIGLSEAVRLLAQPADSGSSNRATGYAVVTFDDGFRDFYTHAFPILDKFGFTATVFLPTGYISDTRSSFKKKKCLTWNEIKELRGQGISFGSHSVTHPQLRRLKKNEVENELKKSKVTMEDKLGERVESFSYPYRFPEEDKRFVNFFRDTIEEAGYDFGVSTIVGTASARNDRYFFGRLPINSCDDTSLFQAKLEGAYNWLHVPQRIYKKARSLIRDRVVV